MHAWLCENPTGVDALAWHELPTPTPKAGEVLIEIKAASLNFPDLLIVQNKFQSPLSARLPGAAGTWWLALRPAPHRRYHSTCPC